MSKEDIDRVLRQIEERTKQEEWRQTQDRLPFSEDKEHAYGLAGRFLIYMEEDNPDVVVLNGALAGTGMTPDRALVDNLNYRLGLNPLEAVDIYASVKAADRRRMKK